MGWTVRDKPFEYVREGKYGLMMLVNPATGKEELARVIGKEAYAWLNHNPEGLPPEGIDFNVTEKDRERFAKWEYYRWWNDYYDVDPSWGDKL